jgi:hypothetical protein
LLGISIPWSVVISLWHAAEAVLFPILIVHWWYPARRSEPWLGKKLGILLATALLAIASLGFLGARQRHGTPLQWGIFGVLILSFLALARLMPGTTGDPEASSRSGIMPLFLGATSAFSYLFLSGVASRKPDLAVFFLLTGAILAAYVFALRLLGWANGPRLIVFAIGGYMISTLIGMITRVAQGAAAVETVIVGVVAEAAMIRWALEIRKGSSGQLPV